MRFLQPRDFELELGRSMPGAGKDHPHAASQLETSAQAGYSECSRVLYEAINTSHQRHVSWIHFRENWLLKYESKEDRYVVAEY